MHKLSKDELLEIEGGAITGSVLSSIVKGIDVFLELGKCLGSAIRRMIDKKPCGYE